MFRGCSQRLLLGGALGLAACAGRVEDVRGVESYVGKIELDGVNRFTKKEFLAYLTIDERSPLIWRPKVPFEEATLVTDAARIRELYWAHGYYEAEVVSMVPVTRVGRVRLLGKHAGERRAGKTRIKIVVREGAPTKVRRLTLRWPDGFPAGPPDPLATPAAIARVSTLREGEAFEIPKLNTTRERLQRRMQSRGYAFAEVAESAVVDVGRGAVVDLELRPGVYVKIGRITIEGLIGVPERRVRDEIDFAPGMRFSPALLARIERTIYGMDVFSSVSIDTAEEAGARGTVDLVIRVVESPTQTIKVGPGLGVDPVRWEQRASLLYAHRNLGRDLTRFELRVTAGYAEMPSLLRPEAHGPLVRVEPRFQHKGFLEKRTHWTLAPGFELGIWQGYQFYSPSLRMGPSRFFGEHVELGLTYNARFVDFFHVSPALRASESILGLDFRDPYFVSFLEPALSLYFVDSMLRPKNGAIIAAIYDIAGLGGNFSFHKVQPTLRLYYTPHERVTLAVRAQIGFMFPFGKRAGTPIDMRFFLGGADSVRGWGLRRLSPKVVLDECADTGLGDDCRGVPVGGQTMVLGNVELRVRMFAKVSAAAFLDMGDVRAGVASFRPRSWNYAAGPGLRYDSPIGIFRLDLGFRLNETDQSSREPRIWAIHLGLGESF